MLLKRSCKNKECETKTGKELGIFSDTQTRCSRCTGIWSEAVLTLDMISKVHSTGFVVNTLRWSSTRGWPSQNQKDLLHKQEPIHSSVEKAKLCPLESSPTYLLQSRLGRDWIYPLIYSLARARAQISLEDRSAAPLFLRHHNLPSLVSAQGFNTEEDINRSHFQCIKARISPWLYSNWGLTRRNSNSKDDRDDAKSSDFENPTSRVG